MKKYIACLLSILLVLLSGCHISKHDAGDGFISNGYASNMRKQKCPDRIIMNGQTLFTLDWTSNSVKIRSEEPDSDALTDAEYNADTRSLVIHLKQSDSSHIFCAFDETGRVISLNYQSDDVSLQTDLIYDKDNSMVYGSKTYYYSDDEPDDPSLFAAAFCRSDNGYAVKSLDNDNSISVSEFGDFQFPEMQMEYDKGGNLLQVTADGTAWLSMSYSDFSKGPWQSMVLNTLYAVLISSGGNGYVGDMPCMLQLGYQIPLLYSKDNLYKETDSPEINEAYYEALTQTDNLQTQSESTSVSVTSSESSYVLKTGVYINNSQSSGECNEEYRPYVALYPDGSCVFYENYYNECIGFEGSYTCRDGLLTLKLQRKAGYDSVSFRYNVNAADEMILLESYDAVCMSQAGDRFVLSSRSLPKKPSEVYSDMSYRDKLVKILWDNYEVWKDKDTEYGTYAMIDLDGDSQVELVFSNIQGSGGYSQNRYFKIDMDNRRVTEISIRNDCYGGIYKNDYYNELDLTAENGLIMYRTPEGKLIFWGSDHERNGAGCWSESFGYLQYDGHSIGENYLFNEYFASAAKGWAQGDEDEHIFTKYTGTDNTIEISEQQYNSELKTARSGWTNMNMTYEFVSLPGMNEDEISFDMCELRVKAKLLESYDAFKCDGYRKK